MALAIAALLLSKLESFLDQSHGDLIGCSEVRREFSELSGVLPKVTSSLRVAEDRDAPCYREFRDTLYYLGDEVEKLMVQLKLSSKLSLLGCDRLFPCPILTHHGPKKRDLINGIRELRERITGFIKDIGPFELPEETPVNLHSHSTLPDNIVFGAERDKQQVIRMLIDGHRSETTPVVIYGIGGSGKTTLAQLIFNDDTIRRNFECFAWVTVSETFDPQRVLRVMLEGFYYGTAPYAVETMSMEDLMKAIHKFLEGKRYLLVLDDVRSTDAWEILALALPDDSGGRIILTTRRRDLFTTFPPEFMWRKEILTVQDSWVLFSKNAFAEGGCPLELVELARKLVGRLQGVPLIILTLARVLRKRRSVREWERVLNSLMLGNYGTIVQDTLLMCYESLSFPARMILLYLSLFPRYQEINVKKSLRWCVAEGFAGEMQEMTAEEVAYKGFQELVSSAMVQPQAFNVTGDVISFKVPDLIIDLARDITKRKKYHEFNTNGISDDPKVLWRLVNQKDSSVLIELGLVSSALRTFIVDGRDVLPSSLTQQLCSRFRLLWVLEIQGTNISALPDGLGTLVHLRYLRLRDTGIKELPASVSKLHNLLSLDIKRTQVRRLPEGVRRLTQLRHIRLAPAFRSEVVELPLQGTTAMFRPLQLQTLAGVRATTRLLEEIGCCTRMRKLSIGRVNGDDSERLCVAINKMGLLRSISIKCDGGESLRMEQFSPSINNNISTLRIGGPVEPFEHVVRSLRGLTRVYLWDNMLKEDPFSALQHLGNLNILVLSNAYSGSEMTCDAGGFPQLKKLSILRMRRLAKGEIRNGGMPGLEFLFIGHCPNLVQLQGLSELSRLRQVTLTEVPNHFEEMVKDDAATVNNQFKVHSFPLFVYKK